MSTTLAMATAACVAALIAVLGEEDPITWITPVFAMLGLVPWALEARGVRLGPWVFVAMTMPPAAMVVLVDGNPGGLFPVFVALVWITHHRTSGKVIVASVAAAVGMTLGCAVLHPPAMGGTIYFLGGVGVSWLGGTLLNRQEGLMSDLRKATERERGRAAAEERTRIAREVHDVIAHSLTVTILQVAGARRALTTDPQGAAEALERAEAVGRESLESIRQVVGLLREADPGAETSEPSAATPLPQASDIHSLVSQYRDAGTQLEASIDLDGAAPGAMTSLTAFRIVQEAMTNALQHAPGATVSLNVRLDDERSAVHVMVENPVNDVAARPHGYRQGHGLIGMSERVRTAGGSIEFGLTPRGTWLVEAELPLGLTVEGP
jgi:glucose-6-phosphate-specific signal transduction histidine kinase